MNSNELNVSIFDAYEALGGQTHVTNRKGSVDVLCPMHLEKTPSCTLSAHNNTFYCHHCEVGGSPVELIRRVEYPNLDQRDGFRAAYVFLEKISKGDVTPMPRAAIEGFRADATPSHLAGERRMQYTFVDHHGVAAYDELRTEGKDAGGEEAKQVRLRRRLPPGRWLRSEDQWKYFDYGGKPVPYGPLDDTQVSRPTKYDDGSDAPEPFGRYLYTMRGQIRYLYRVPAVLAAGRDGAVVAFPEGPKKADAVTHRIGVCGTTVAGGAGADLTPEQAIYLTGVSGVLQLADSDDKGRACAMRRASILSHVVPDVRVIDFFGDNSGRDVMQWLKEQGRANAATLRERLQALADRAVRVTPNGCAAPTSPFPTLGATRGLQPRQTGRNR
jgi:CHC2 zinc finger